MERFVIVVNGHQPLTIITKRSILDVAAALDPPLATWIHATLNPDTNFCCRSKKQDRNAATVPPGLEFFKGVDFDGFYLRQGITRCDKNQRFFLPVA